MQLKATAEINKITGPNGENYEKDPLSITAELVTNGVGITEAMNNAGNSMGWPCVVAKIALIAKEKELLTCLQHNQQSKL